VPLPKGIYQPTKAIRLREFINNFIPEDIAQFLRVRSVRGRKLRSAPYQNGEIGVTNGSPVFPDPLLESLSSSF